MEADQIRAEQALEDLLAHGQRAEDLAFETQLPKPLSKHAFVEQLVKQRTEPDPEDTSNNVWAVGNSRTKSQV